MTFVYDDGGRRAAGYRGDAGDCVTRAIAIASGLDYREVYDRLHDAARSPENLARLERHYGRTGRRHASPRTGARPDVYRPLLDALGFVWTPTMRIGSGCTVHLRADELPGGVLIARVTRHLTTVIDGVIHDTHDPSRDGTRCVYGYWARDHLAQSASHGYDDRDDSGTQRRKQPRELILPDRPGPTIPQRGGPP